MILYLVREYVMLNDEEMEEIILLMIPRLQLY